MNDQELDTCYTALCEAINRVGEERASLFLGMLSLSLISRQPHPDDTLSLITQAEEHLSV
jgi:hypothetical protein